MANQKEEPVVFVSYSLKEEEEKNQLLSHLGVLRAVGLIELWSDDRILAGAARKWAISKAISDASVAIMGSDQEWNRKRTFAPIWIKSCDNGIYRRFSSLNDTIYWVFEQMIEAQFHFYYRISKDFRNFVWFFDTKTHNVFFLFRS